MLLQTLGGAGRGGAGDAPGVPAGVPPGQQQQRKSAWRTSMFKRLQASILQHV